MIETSARLLKLLALLQVRREWTGADLASRLEVSGRTVRKDIERLRSLGYPVEATRGATGGYRLGSGAEMPPLILDDDEAVAVAISLATASTRGVGGVEEAGLTALAKLQQLLPTRLRHRVDALRTTAALVPYDGGDANVDATVLQDLALGSRQRETLRIAYTRHDGDQSRRMVEPHRLVNWDRRWYLLAWDRGRDDWRTYRVDRIARVEPTGLQFPHRDPPSDDIATWVSDRVARAGWQYHVVATIAAPVGVIRARIPSTYGTVEPVNDETCRLQSGTDDLVATAFHLASLGYDFTVESPQELTIVIEDLAQRLAGATRT